MGWRAGVGEVVSSLASPFLQGPTHLPSHLHHQPDQSQGKCHCISSCQVVSLGPQLIIPRIWETTDAFVTWFRCPKGLDLIMSWANAFCNP